MGHIKEPIGVNLIVDPTPVTTSDKRIISEIIAYYNATGLKMPTDKMEMLFAKPKTTTTNRVSTGR